MPESTQVVDLRDFPDRLVTLEALGPLRALAPGNALRLLTRESPALLMESLNLQLRGALVWESVEQPGGWATTVRHAGDLPARDLVDALGRDHRRLDALLGRALRRLNAADLPGARLLLEPFIDGLRRHVHAENEVVAPALGPAASHEALQTMLHEHGELVGQLAAIDDALTGTEAGAEAWEVEPFVALLSGTLAKHEHREETQLFALWSARLAELPAGEAERLNAAVEGILAGR